MYHNNFRDLVLLDPIQQGAERLKIVTGYATHTMASWHIKEIASRQQKPIEITLIVGMCKFDGISKAVHEGFNDIVARNNTPLQSNLICQYVTDGTPVHSKLYLWEREGEPFKAYMGSANYTQSAFSTLHRRELIKECDPIEAMQYFNSIERDTTYCNHAEVEDAIKITSTHPILEAEDAPIASVQGLGIESITLSLLATRGSRKGETGWGSGVNWGHRKNGTKREPNQMYISLPTSYANTDFFTLSGNRSGKDNPHFSVLTDDGVHFVLRVEQGNNKAITTPLNNSQIGEYFRRRIGVANGAFITKDDLENYGRTDVTFYKLDDEQYIMDFSL